MVTIMIKDKKNWELISELAKTIIKEKEQDERKRKSNMKK